MTSNPLKLACLSICLQASFAQAQQDADAALRAQRDASNPLRMIIEASKLKPRQKAAEPEVAPKAVPEKGAVRASAAKPATPPAVLAAAPEQTPSLGVTAAVAEPAQPAVVAPVEQTPPAAAAEPAPQEATVGPSVSPAPAVAVAALTTAPAQASPPAADPPPPTAAPAAATQVALAAPSPTQPSPANAQANAPAGRVSLQLANYVEPVLPDRVRRRLQGEAAVVVKFTVNPDGTVADVAVRSSSDRGLDAIALDAVSQWRYKPIAAAQPHAVELVFKTAN